MDEPMQLSSDPAPKASDIQAVERAAHILGLFGDDCFELTVPSAALRLGLNRTTVHRYFASMVAAGLLARGHGPGAFVPGPLAVQLGAFTLGRRTVIEMADRHLRHLAELFRMSAVLSLWGARGPVVTTVREDRTGAVLITVPVGTQLSLDTAQSVLYLAYMTDQLAAQGLLASLPAATQRQVGAQVHQARIDGVAARAFDDGVTSVAAPVFAPDGICATIALIHTSAMLSTDSRSVQAAKLRVTADELTGELGGHRPLQVASRHGDRDAQ